MSTKERILVAALALFNERGTDVITVRHVAQAVGMSHGNLCYHYVNIDAIISSLYDQLVAHLSAQIAAVMREGVALVSVQRLTAGTMATLYGYRFLMLDFAGIMRRIPTIREKHRVLLGHRAVVFRQMLASLRAAGLLRPEFYAGHDDYLLTQLFIVGDFWIASAEWLYEGEVSTRLPYYQRVLTALLVPLFTELGWAEWYQVEGLRQAK